MRRLLLLVLLLAPIASANLLTNGDFHSGLSGWEVIPLSGGDLIRVAEVHEHLPGPTLEMTAAHNSQLLVYQKVSYSGTDLFFQYRGRILSHRGGRARIYLQPFDAQGNPLGTLGWQALGPKPPNTATENWQSWGIDQNYLGREHRPTLDLSLWTQLARGISPGLVEGWGVYILLEDGAHGIFNDFYLGPQRPDPLPYREQTPYGSPAKVLEYAQTLPLPANPSPLGEALEIQLSQTNLQGLMGEAWSLTAEVKNTRSEPLSIKLTAQEPYGFGLGVHPREVFLELGAGERQVIPFEISAQRPHAVNLGNPWSVFFLAQAPGEQAVAELKTWVEDPRPGVIYYVMTEDLEPLDAAGYPAPYGNQNSWMDPEEYRIQLLEKSVAMNRIAEEFGAVWSHFICWPAIEGARWAATQSSTGQWEAVIADLEEMVRQEAHRGHQYTPHLHIDYDPWIPGQIQRYDPATDGYWANYAEHGWARHITDLGSFDEQHTRIGSLFFYQQALEALHGQGQVLGTRVGTFDIGDTRAEMAKSVEAFRQVGLWGSSDAGGNRRVAVGAPYGSAVYFTRPDDIELPATDLRQIGLVQFRPTPTAFIDQDKQTPTQMNQKVREGMEAYAPGGEILPGVHGIISFTHAMFMMGDGDWRSTTGGAFENLRVHLRDVSSTWVETGLLHFGTAHDLISAYLDYYTPTLQAIYKAPEEIASGVYLYPIRLLGRDIPLGPESPHSVDLKIPLVHYGLQRKVEVLRDGEIIAQTGESRTPRNEISFTVDGQGEYQLRVILN